MGDYHATDEKHNEVRCDFKFFGGERNIVNVFFVEELFQLFDVAADFLKYGGILRNL